MKQLLSILLVISIISALSIWAFAGSSDWASFSDDQLVVLYSSLKQELFERGIEVSEKKTLREGKYIIGDDIAPGNYRITCIETSGEVYGGIYSSLGGLYNDSMSSLFDSLGGMMETIINVKVEIIGDYGTVLKSVELKKGDVIDITLSEGTALQISEGSCSIESR